MKAGPTCPAKVFLWRYRENRRNYPGYHLTADEAGCQRLLRVLADHEGATHRLESEIPLTPVTPAVLAVPANRRGDATVVSLATWHLTTDPSWQRGYFHFEEFHPICRLALSPAQAGCLRAGVEDVQRGEGDYCIGGDDHDVIWFWWLAGR